MRVQRLVMAGVALLSCAVAAPGAILINSTRVAGTGDNANWDVVRFYATIPTGAPEGAALTSANVELFFPVSAPSDANFRFRYTDIGGDGYGDVDIDSRTVALRGTAGSNGTMGTHVRVGTFSASDYVVADVSPTPYLAAYDGTSGARTGPDPATVYGLSGANFSDPQSTVLNHTYASNVKSFRVEMTNSGSPDTSAQSNTNNPGQGALFAVAVVPHNYAVSVQPGPNSGGLAGTSGGIYAFSPYTDVPEPGCGVLACLALVFFSGRRRRVV